MIKRTLGNSGIEVAPLAFGGNVFGWTVDEADTFKLLDAFVAAGFNLIDTANVYSRWKPGNQGGESEMLIGKWMAARANRDKVVIATKVGNDMGAAGKGLSKQYIIRAVEESLKRLQTDYIDLYQSHIDDMSTPLHETLEAYAQLIKEGKVRAIGASNYTADRLTTALEISEKYNLPYYISLQPLYNLYDTEVFEKELQPLCVKHNIGVIPYYALASGFLTGKYRSENDLQKSVRGGGITKYMNEKGFRILKALDAVANEHNSTPAQVSLAWLMAQPSIVAPIASATSIEQLTDILQSTELKLSATALAALDKASKG